LGGGFVRSLQHRTSQTSPECRASSWMPTGSTAGGFEVEDRSARSSAKGHRRLESWSPVLSVRDDDESRLEVIHLGTPLAGVRGILWLCGVDCSIEFVDGRDGGQAYGGVIFIAVLFMPIGVGQNHEPRS